MITHDFLDRVLQDVDLNTNTYSIIRKPLSREERSKIILVLLPALNERLKETQHAARK